MIRTDKEEWRHNGKGDKRRSEMDGIGRNRTKYNRKGMGMRNWPEMTEDAGVGTWWS